MYVNMCALSLSRARARARALSLWVAYSLSRPLYLSYTNAYTMEGKTSG